MRLRLASGLVYAAFAAFGLASIARPLATSARAVCRPFTYAPDLTLPWLWLGLAAALVVLVAEVVRRLAAGARVGLARYVALLALSLFALALRHEIEPPSRVPVQDGLSATLARVAVAADAAFDREKAYPTDASALASELPPAVRDLGFRSRFGRVAPTRLLVRPGALDPVLLAGGLAPGTVVFAVDPSRHRYWLTAVALDRRGKPSVLEDGSGRAVLLEGVDGHPRSPLDDAFPEYPHKMSLGGPAPAP